MATRTRDRQRGQMLVIFALALVAIIAMVGLVIDGGAAYAQRRGQQNAADLAALAAADALYNAQTQSQAVAVAKGVTARNSYADTANGVVVTVTFPPNKVQVDISAPHQNYFARVVGQPTWQVSTTAQAVAGTPDTAVGAAPVIMSIQDFNPDGSPKSQFSQANCSGTNADGSTGCIWGNGNGDVPNNATDWAWTLYGDNVNTSTVRDYLEGVGQLNGMAGCNGTPPPAATIADGTAPYWGQGNNGMHNGAFNSANCIIGLDVPVPIVGPPVAPATTCTNSSQTDGCFKGWAMFHVTDWSKHGNQSHWMGYFLPSGVEYPTLTITNCSGVGCPEIGTPQLKLVN
jgi:Flp pilus assembly protein TadG